MAYKTITSPMKQILGDTNNIAMKNQMAINPSAMMPNAINPKAVGNPMTVNGVYGNANDSTFTRTVNDGPQLPPQGVQTSVTPTLGFENN